MKLFLLAVRFRPDRKHTASPLPVQRLFYVTHTCIFSQSIYQLTNALNKIPYMTNIKLLHVSALRQSSRTVFLNHRALASIIPDRERPEETTICYKISLVQLITNLNVILYLSICHTVYISVVIIFMIMT
jgi:hypothetical protein